MIEFNIYFIYILIFLVKPSVEVKSEETLNTKAGQLLKIGSCTATNGKPKPTILWKDNNGVQYTGVETQKYG